jgi:cytochrome c peroxidase
VAPHVVRLVAAAVAAAVAASSAAQKVDPAPTPPPALGTVWIPEPTRLAEFVADRDVAIALGKALFWDIAFGSDMQTACATCHGHAGVDPRTLNTVHPGFNGTFDAGVGPGGLKPEAFFPTTLFANPDSRFSTRLRSVDDVVGSQGVLRRAFLELNAETGEDRCTDVADPVFNDGVRNVRQVTGRNPPTVINAAFNVRQFWDGRANPWFNGVDPFGPTNPQARVQRWDAATGALVPVALQLDFAGLASQAVGPANNGVEMACEGRDWGSLGRRLLEVRPLAAQRVSATDSVLGSRAAADGFGLATTYRALIQQAFRPEWHGAPAVPGAATQIEANFPLYFGIALMLYQSTLVSDDSPYDRFAEAGFPEDGGGHLDGEALLGLDLFMNVGQFEDLPITRCVDCHATPLFTSATWAGMGVTAPPAPGPVPYVAQGGIERMLAMAETRAATVTFANHAADGDPAIRPLTFQVSGRSIELIRLQGNSNDPDDGEEIIDDELPQFPANACGLVRNSIMNPEEGTGMLVAEVRREPLPGGGCGTWLRLTLELFPVGRYAVLINGTYRATLQVLPDGAYDMGFYNIGVRPTIEDLGIGGPGFAGTPLSWTRRVQLGLPTPEFNPSVPVPPGIHAAVHGAFKTPTLRNVELTGPYFHNGGSATLRQTVEFYNRGGDFHEANAADLSPQMVTLGLRDHEIDALVSFMHHLTDERVRDESAPFDHPELPLPNGESIPAVGAAGRVALGLPPLRSFEDRITGPGDLGDFNRDGAVDGIDLGMLLGSWGSCPASGACACDLNGDREVDGIDLGAFLGRWGNVTG